MPDRGWSRAVARQVEANRVEARQDEARRDGTRREEVRQDEKRRGEERSEEVERAGRGLEESERGRGYAGQEAASRWSEVSGVHDLTSGPLPSVGPRGRQDALKITPQILSAMITEI